MTGEDAVRKILEIVGEDPTRDGLIETPARVIKAFREFTVGYSQDPAQILSKTFDVQFDEMVVLTGIRFQSLCEHHLLPFTGVAHVAYIPRDRVVGLSKLAKLVDCYAKRLQVQERLTLEVAQAIMNNLNPIGAACIIESHHACMGHRGARQPDARMKTSAMLGAFREPEVRAEFLKLAG